jgi:hypothetical protein
MPANMSASDAMVLANIDPSLRGERLHVSDFGRLAEVLREHFNPR